VIDGNITIPKVGQVPKKAVVAVVGAGVAYVGYRYYAAAQGGDTGTGDEASDFADGGLPPGVIGAVSPTNSYGDAGADTSDGTDGTLPTTNSAWSALAAQQLTQSDTWSYTDIVTALGNYLAGVPLSSTQQAIVRAAIAVAGYPPVGTHSIVSGGDTPLIVAPGGFKVTTTATTATLTCTAVAGAASYRAYRTGSATNIGSAVGPSITVGGLNPGTKYTFHMRAVSSSGQLSPSSPSITISTTTTEKTPPATGPKPPAHSVPKAPTGFSVVTTATTARLKCNPVAGAASYRAYRAGSETNVGTASGPEVTVGGLTPGKSYTWHMRAVNAAGIGAPSKKITTKTKAK